jgi:hypothetical protein
MAEGINKRVVEQIDPVGLSINLTQQPVVTYRSREPLQTCDCFCIKRHACEKCCKAVMYGNSDGTYPRSQHRSLPNSDDDE